jgi:hypothetical protein
MKFKIGQMVKWGEAIGTIIEIANFKKKTYKVDFGYLVEIEENKLNSYE